MAVAASPLRLPRDDLKGAAVPEKAKTEPPPRSADGRHRRWPELDESSVGQARLVVTLIASWTASVSALAKPRDAIPAQGAPVVLSLGVAVAVPSGRSRRGRS